MSAVRPLSCSRASRWLYPALDGVLPPRDLADLDAHLAACAACRAVRDREVAFRAHLARAAAARRLAPAALHARLREALLPEAQPPAASPRPVRRRVGPFLLAAAVAAAVAGVLLVEPLLREGSSTPALVRSVVAQQSALADGRLPLEMRSRSSGAVADWLRARLRFPVELPPATADRVEVVGVRLTELAASEAAAVVYRVDGRPVTLFTFPAATLQASGARIVEVGRGGHHFRIYRIQGLAVTLWARGTVGYALAAPADVAASHGCAVCHLGDEAAGLERALDAGLAPR